MVRIAAFVVLIALVVTLRVDAQRYNQSDPTPDSLAGKGRQNILQEKKGKSPKTKPLPTPKQQVKPAIKKVDEPARPKVIEGPDSEIYRGLLRQQDTSKVDNRES